MNLISRFADTARVAAVSLADRRVAYWPAEKVQRLQNRRVQSIVRHAYDTVPYYRSVMDEMRIKSEDIRTAAELACLPIIGDHDIRKDPSLFTSSTLNETSSLRMFTTGSSGVPKPYWVDRQAALSRLVITARDRAVLSRLMGRNWGQIQLFLIPEASNTFRTQVHWDRNLIRRRTLARRAVFSIEASFDAVIGKINEMRPHIVFSYGSYADEFFRYLADRKPNISLPRVWMYGGDAMSPQARLIAEDSFGCVIYSTYNAVETGKLGFECELRRGFHLNVDYCAVRIVDDSGRDVPPGTAGEIVISNLYNRATVLLNHRLGDIGVIAAAPCPCGRSLPLLAHLMGKKLEYIRFADGSRHVCEVLEMVFEKELAGALQSQLCQSGSSSVLWRVVPASAVDKNALQRSIIDKWRAAFGESVGVRVEMVEKVDRSHAGKLLRVVHP